MTELVKPAKSGLVNQTVLWGFLRGYRDVVTITADKILRIDCLNSSCRVVVGNVPPVEAILEAYSESIHLEVDQEIYYHLDLDKLRYVAVELLKHVLKKPQGTEVKVQAHPTMIPEDTPKSEVDPEVYSLTGHCKLERNENMREGVYCTYQRKKQPDAENLFLADVLPAEVYEVRVDDLASLRKNIKRLKV